MERMPCAMALKSASQWPADTTHTSRASRVLRAGAEKRRRTDYTRGGVTGAGTFGKPPAREKQHFGGVQRHCILHDIDIDIDGGDFWRRGILPLLANC